MSRQSPTHLAVSDTPTLTLTPMHMYLLPHVHRTHNIANTVHPHIPWSDGSLIGKHRNHIRMGQLHTITLTETCKITSRTPQLSPLARYQPTLTASSPLHSTATRVPLTYSSYHLHAAFTPTVVAPALRKAQPSTAATVQSRAQNNEASQSSMVSCQHER